MHKNKIPNKYFYVAIILLVIYLVFRLVNLYGIVGEFPLDSANDHSAHMSHLYFLDEYGFGNNIENWYTFVGGFPLLKYYHPGRAFFSMPFYYMFGSVEAATYFAMLSIIIFGFIAIYYFGKHHGFSKTKRIALWALFFINPVLIGYYRIGRHSEIFGFLWMIIFTFIVLWYKDRKIDWKFLWFIPVYSTLVLSHVSVFLISSMLILSLLLVKRNKERLLILLSCFITFLITMFWTIPFIRDSGETFVGVFYGLQRTLLLFTRDTLMDNISAFVIPIIFFFVFYIYYKTNKKKRELIFYSVPLIIGALFFTRILTVVPFLNRLVPDTYNMFFLFLALYLFMKIDYSELEYYEKNIIKYGLFIVPLIAIFLSLMFTSFYEGHTQENKDIISLLPEVNDQLLIIGIDGYPRPYYSYGAIYHNIYTPSGWGEQAVSYSDREKSGLPQKYLLEKNCELFLKSMENIGGKEIITREKNCDFLIECGMILVRYSNEVCLLEIKE